MGAGIASVPPASRAQRDLLTWARQALAGREGADPAQEARILMEWVLDCENLWVAPATLAVSRKARFIDAVQRRCCGEPLQHIIGRMWFRGLTLRCWPEVFVVRPETESVAGVAIEEGQRLAAERRISGAGADDGGEGAGEGGPFFVDLCTGSGAIAVAAAVEVPGARVIGVEKDPVAVELARANVQDVAPGRVTIIDGDATDRNTLALCEGAVDIVVANPPYIPDREPVTQVEALHDPLAALYGGGEDGMVVPRGILTIARYLLRPGGLVVVEHATSQAREMCLEAEDRGFIEIATRADLTGRDRMLVARQP